MHLLEENALSFCLSQNGKLWEPKSLARINQVHDKAILVKKTQSWWVGLSDAGSEGTFKYDSNNEHFPFENNKAPWVSYEPNGGSTENCAVMLSWIALWQDVKCNYANRYSICEFPSDSTGNMKIIKKKLD